MIERRAFLTGLISLVAAPAIVRAGSLMPVNASPEFLRAQRLPQMFVVRRSLPQASWREINALVFYGRSPAMTALGILDDLPMQRRTERAPPEQQ